MNNVIRSIATGVALGSISLSSLAGPSPLSESQMDAVSAGTLPAFAFGNLLSVLDFRAADVRERVPTLVQILESAQRRMPDGSICQPEFAARMAGDNPGGQGLVAGAAMESLHVVASAATPAAVGNTLRSGLAPLISPTAMSGASSFIP